MTDLLARASRITALPFLSVLSPAATEAPTREEIEGYLASQRLAQQAAKEIGSLLQGGWTEEKAAGMLDTYLRDNGVKSYFHRPFAWFGDRTRFNGIRSYSDFSASRRRLGEGDSYILDAAPILHGFTCDIGYSGSLGVNPGVETALKFLRDLREEIPLMFSRAKSGGEVWEEVRRRFEQKGYDNIHARYPFSVLGHRVHRAKEGLPWLGLWNFGWQSYWELASRGLFGQLLTRWFEGELHGLWAVEPHLGGPGFGAKFEEILVIDDKGAHWLDERNW